MCAPLWAVEGGVHALLTVTTRPRSKAGGRENWAPLSPPTLRPGTWHLSGLMKECTILTYTIWIVSTTAPGGSKGRQPADIRDDRSSES